MTPDKNPPPIEDAAEEPLTVEELHEAWSVLSPDERLEGFRLLERLDQEDFFFELQGADQAELVLRLPAPERRAWMRQLPPDDAADVIQEAPAAERDALMALLDDQTRREVTALLAYAEDVAGGLMNPRYPRVRPEMTVDEAISYLRRQSAQQTGEPYHAYVLDAQQKLLGIIELYRLFMAPPARRVSEIMATDIVTIPEQMDQESVSRLFSQHDLVVLPVVDDEGHMKGVVTVDDIVDVVQEEATEDIQKIGGMEALEEPYLKIGLARMMRKRGGWLAALFLGEMLTATAMAHYEHQISRAVVLTLFIPLIISSGGNSGSQASTLVVRALALGEVRLRDWWRVIRRELATGLMLGLLLGTIGFFRVVLFPSGRTDYSAHAARLGLTVASALVGVVLFGTLCGSMLPLLLRRIGLDPASASAPFVATLVDVTGLVIYFTMASLLLRGIML